MRYATFCTGIGGFDHAFDSVGMKPVYQCEIDQHCQSVLSRHWPNVEKGMDVDDKQTESDIVRLKPDLIAFGSPCQDLSVAGRRGGLAGERSGLFFRCVELCFAAQAHWVVWENVPGVFSSNEGQDFASVIEAFTGVRPDIPPSGWRNTGVCIGPLYSIAWVVLDSQWFGVPQRRRRVFIVGHLGDRGSPYEILSLPESLPWDSPPRREAKSRIAASLTRGAESSGKGGAAGRRQEDDFNIVVSSLRGNWSCDQDGDETKLVAYGGNNAKGPIDVATACNASGSASGRHDFESETFVMQERMEAENPKSGPGGKGWSDKGIAFTLEARTRPQSVAFAQNQRGELRESKVSPQITCGGGKPGEGYPAIRSGSAVRRLTPREAERLQGFPDDWTLYGADGEQMSDSARYRMLGNAVTVNVAEWIGRRIMQLENPKESSDEP